MSLRILLIMDPLIPVPPLHYGGIERVIADLADGLVDKGHQVTLWAAAESRTKARLVPFGHEGEWSRWSNIRNVATLTRRFASSRFDVIHNFGRLAYLLSAFRRDVPKIQTYMRTVNPANMRLASRLGARRMHYTAVSAAMRDTGAPGGGDWSVIYNCAPTRLYDFRGDTDPRTAPLVFLGRLDRCKGAHTAIEVARRTGRALRIAGTISDIAHEQEYFRTEIEPQLDGKQITFLGPVDDEQKNELLGTAAALLVPIEWEEPFPVILPESFLCGTPLIAFRRGGVPEGIDHGRTGFVCDTAEEMADYVGRLPEIDRSACREEAMLRFSDSAIVDEYERLYYEMVGAPASDSQQSVAKLV